ncbi:MAG: alpha/beta hydrolase, partial [Hyphomonadaceae bacterium]
MPQITANGIPLEYDIHGPESGEPLLLIMGLGVQMTRWPQEMVDDLARRGYRVIRHDNRDVGLSHKFDEHGPSDIGAIVAALRTGVKPPAPYLLSDMAADSVGLLDALGIKQAHIVGASMGGMIAQTIASTYPDRVLSLTSIMSTTGNPNLPPARPDAMARLVIPSPDPTKDLEAYLLHALSTAHIMAGEGNPVDEAQQRIDSTADAKRAFYPVGVSRQMAAVVAMGDRRKAIATITAPTVVIHGADDPLVPVEAGQDTQTTVPGAEMHILAGMGHNLPRRLIPQINDLIERAT